MKGIFTAHGETKEELMRNPTLNELINEKIIEKIVFLKLNKDGRRKEVEEKIC